MCRVYRSVILFCVAFLAGSAAHAQVWSRINSGIPSDATLSDVYFISDDEGIAVGNYGAAYRTTNGGQSWSAFHPLDCSQCIITYSQLLFFAPDDGYLWANVSAQHDTSLLLHSTDRGVTWRSVPYVSPGLQYFGSFKLGFSGGYSQIYGTGDPIEYEGIVVRSRDAGITFDTLYQSKLNEIQGEAGYLVAGDSSHLLLSYNISAPTTLVSTNGGSNWSQQDGYFRGAVYLGSSVWLCSDDSTGIYRLQGLGKANKIATTPVPVFRLYTSGDEKTIYATISDSNQHVNDFLKSSDGGLSWNFVHTSAGVGNSKDYRAWPQWIRWTPNGTAYALLMNDTIIRENTSSGVSPSPKNNSVIELYPNPTTDEIFINVSDALQYQVLDCLGHVWLSGDTKSIDCRKLPNGIYYLITDLGSNSFLVQHGR